MARGEVQEEKESLREEVDLVQRPNYKETTTTDEEQSESREESDEDDPDIEFLHHYSEEDMGGPGDMFNDADLYFTARYIASVPDLERLNHKERWDLYHEKVCGSF